MGKNLILNTFLIIILIFSPINSTNGNICAVNVTNCGNCIGISQACVWCSDPRFEDEKQPGYTDIKRCDTLEGHRNNQKNICSSEYLVNPIGNEVQYRENYTIQLANETLNLKARHISPQKVHLKLRVGESKTIEMNYLYAERKQIDLYYLLDISATMVKNKEVVQAQGKHLIDQLTKLSEVEVRFGLGSFIDKPLPPFASPRQFLQYGPDHEIYKTPPYGFKHHLNFTNNPQDFVEAFKGVLQSANTDLPEGSLDALMQALVCEKVLGWRPFEIPHRRLIVLATDAAFHIAGDGKLAGIVLPNDAKCHMEQESGQKSWIYTHSTILDYPSTSQIVNQVSKSNTSVIFAVNGSDIDLFEKLSNRSSYFKTIKLADDSSNIVGEIIKKYKEIESEIRIEDMDYNRDLIEVEISSKCINQTDFIPGRVCSELNFGNLVEFQINVKLAKCPRKSKILKEIIKIRPFEINEELLIEVEGICECDCSNSTYNFQGLEVCRNGGSLSCGSCKCLENFASRHCECRKDEKYKSKINEGCKKDSQSSDSVVCSTLGEDACICNKCVCTKKGETPRFEGPFCEIDNEEKCGKVTILNSRCSGKGTCVPVVENSTIIDRICNCTEQYSGPYCQCDSSEEPCIDPLKNEICSNNGVCDCDFTEKSETFLTKKCICKPSYTGDYCDEKAGKRQGSHCDEYLLNLCLDCQLNEHNNDFRDKKCSNNCIYEKKVTFNVNFEKLPRQRCTKIRNGCKIDFDYEIGQNEVTIWTEHPPVEACTINYFLIIGSVVGGILAVGLITLFVWKFSVHLIDTKEFSKFEKERENAKWGTTVSPLYENPTTEFQNPAFTGK